MARRVGKLIQNFSKGRDHLEYQCIKGRTTLSRYERNRTLRVQWWALVK
jgi:hypothetical protein